MTFARKRIKSCLAAGTRPSLLQLRRWHWFAIEPVYEMWLPVFGFALTGIGLGSRRDRKAKWLCILFFAGLLFQVACGGGEQTARQSPTPIGQHTITVTGTSGSLRHSTTVVLTVQ